jgi:hypothetical protein
MLELQINAFFIRSLAFFYKSPFCLNSISLYLHNDGWHVSLFVYYTQNSLMS